MKKTLIHIVFYLTIYSLSYSQNTETNYNLDFIKNSSYKIKSVSDNKTKTVTKYRFVKDQLFIIVNNNSARYNYSIDLNRFKDYLILPEENKIILYIDKPFNIKGFSNYFQNWDKTNYLITKIILNYYKDSLAFNKISEAWKQVIPLSKS